MDWQVCIHHEPRQCDRMRCAAHIFLHDAHIVAGLDVQPAGIETHTLADKRQRWSGRAPIHFDQTRGLICGPPDCVDHREVLLQQCVACDRFAGGSEFVRQRFGCGLQLIRSHIGGWRVDQIAGQCLGICQYLQLRGINAFTLGARAVNPEATVEVIWTSTWFDPTIEGNSAQALLEKGIDVLAMHQDTPSVGQAAEEAAPAQFQARHSAS